MRALDERQFAAPGLKILGNQLRIRSGSQQIEVPRGAVQLPVSHMEEGGALENEPVRQFRFSQLIEKTLDAISRQGSGMIAYDCV